MGFLSLRVVVSQNLLLELTNRFSLSQVIVLHPQTGQSPLGGYRGREPLTGDLITTVYSPQFVLQW